MSLASLISRANVGIDAPEVRIEVHITHGKSLFSIVGLPETAVKESRERVRSALINSGFDFPMQRITVNLAPADLPKEGGRFDLPIALGILAACGVLPRGACDTYEFAGELSLSGRLKAFSGALLLAKATARCDRSLILPLDNAAEAAMPLNSQAYGAATLVAVYQHLCGQSLLTRANRPMPANVASDTNLELTDVIGQTQAKRALLIAASGGHHMLMAGPPGTGKTMLATRLLGLLPPMSETEALEVAAIRSLTGQAFHADQWRQRPFRSPHHTASSIALVGGSSPPRPGEISLAHQGVLFLDELPEFSRQVLEALREPLESAVITISRAALQAEFPARFQLVAAMNPCPCGYANSVVTPCRCSVDQIKRYQNRLSGPFLDRIDLHLYLKPLPQHMLLQAQSGTSSLASDSSSQLRQVVVAARQHQYQRQTKLNQLLSAAELKTFCRLDSASQKILKKALDHWPLSGRAIHRILRVTRTIADLAACETIQEEHVSEALNYRSTL